MRIGITVHFQFSVFSGGGASAALSIAECLLMLGHEVTLINLSGTSQWWDDIQSLKDVFKRVNLPDISEPFDLVLEVTNTLPDAETRKRIAKKCIWVVRKPIILNDIEHSIFPISLAKRSMEGLFAVWTLDLESTSDDIQYLETLTRVPVRKVPFTWSPATIEYYRRESNIPSWLQVTIQLTQQAGQNIPWSPHICESNNSATSSCTIPLVILRELKQKGEFFMKRYNIHNAQQIENSTYFKQNVLNHCQIDDLSGNFMGRQRVLDWVMDPMSCVLGHLRFRRIRPYMLDVLWCGIPFVHNSMILKNLGCEYENYYYEDNSITGGVRALTHLQRDLVAAHGMFKPGNMAALQQKIIATFSPMSVTVQNGWKEALASLDTVVSASVPAPAPAITPFISTQTETQTQTQIQTQTELNILFTDMWDDFNPAYNMFLLIVNEGSKNLVPRPKINGYSIETLPQGVRPNFHLFGPFGGEWQSEKWVGIPKAHFTGENTHPIVSKDMTFNMGFQHADFLDERYIRLPLWMLEIDWFGCDPTKIQNPKPIPLDSCLKPLPETDRSRFCAFVVTNPCNPVRNSAFHWLNRYKNVDSAGRLFNTIGDELFAGLGGGGGELKKHEFLKKYKFCLAYENSSSQGYTTEKLLHAKAAGCIPIYWGDPKVERDFDPKGFIDARDLKTPEDLIEAVRLVDSDPELYKKIYSVPALDEYKRDIVRRTLSQVALNILKASFPSASIKQEMIPRFVGASSSEEAARMRLEREGTALTVIEKPEIKEHSGLRLIKSPKNPSTTLSLNPMIVTFATLRFLPSLHQFLQAMAAQQKVITGLQVKVWLGDDVTKTVEENLTTTFPFSTFVRLPTSEVPSGFPDFWNPEHFAWKLWIYKTVATDPTLKDRLIFYLDSGSFMCRWPKTWFQIVMEEGICALEDPNEENARWCHATFCEALKVTEEEKKEHQLLAGAIAFIGGSPKSISLFTQAYEWSKRREVITGPKWAGVKDGKPFGHRHDQSILSILSTRLGVPRYPMEEIYCDHSLRKTFLSGKSIYFHRGGFTLHKPFAAQIDDSFVINLDRRADRMEKLYTNNPELKGRVSRFSAIEGKKIKLTPALARLFKPHDFFWKKAIMGCALSHLSLWFQLIIERPEISNYLILEDDVKLQPDWERRWNEAAGHIPEDYDVIYLGGILPPNRAGFERSKQRVNAYFSQVAPNKFFGQPDPNRYFHWCAYSYVLSRKGAVKILDILAAHDGYWTSADHMICNPVQHMNLYFLDPLVAGCYQDDDPRYATSNFNDFSRIDGFDSDLWNNDERFSAAEVEPLLREAERNAIGINVPLALEDLKHGMATHTVLEPKSGSVEKEEVIGKEEPSVNAEQLLQKEALTFISLWTLEQWSKPESVKELKAFIPHLRRSPMPTQDPPIAFVKSVVGEWDSKKPSGPEEETWSKIQERLQSWSKCQELSKPVPRETKRRILTLKQHNFNIQGMYERTFLEELFGPTLPISVECIDEDAMPNDTPLVIVQRPHIDAYQRLFTKWNSAGIKFYILHLSDEFCNDRIDFYSLPSCIGVLRNYQRSDIPVDAQEKTIILPLGYHWTTHGASDDPLNKTPRLPFRNTVWSFYGTDWQNRSASLASLATIGPNVCRLLPSWESPEKLSETQYISLLLDSYFVPCPSGNNEETYRLYEALECGCVPLYVKRSDSKDDAYVMWLQKEIGLLPVRTWEEVRILINHFMNDKNTLENYRDMLLSKWVLWKRSLGEKVRKLLVL
jgi:GR25 family glycosyltransferase involved in LPS biosynthesis